MRLILILAGALALSAAINIAQVSSRAKLKAEHEGAIKAAELRGKLQAADEYAGRSAIIATLAQADHASLLRQLTELAERGRERVTVYRDRVSLLPAATCAPGPERIDAVNALLESEP